MTLYLHHLTGCAPAPLARYLKALGILRVVAEQKDREARGFWQDEHFCLLTALDQKKLEKFLLEEYAPTPFVSPWNKGSGFFSSNDPALSPIENSSAPRFEAYRSGIKAARVPHQALAAADADIRAIKARTKAQKGMSAGEKAAAKALKETPEFKAELAAADRHFKNLKADLFNPCAQIWRGPHRAWMDAAVVLPEAGKPAFPSLLGTGGNDGRIDFTNNAMQRIAELFDVATDGGPRSNVPSLLAECLFFAPTHGLSPAKVGQFSPGDAGGANTTTGPQGEASVNPWDFVLMLEGSILFSARTTRRLDPMAAARASAPFCVRAHPIGHGTPGAEKADRGEQWMPLWSRPASLGDLSALLGEARVQLGRQVASRPLDVARAMSRLGVDRGINEFVRYGYLERNGQSTLAVPLGRVGVRARPQARLVDDIASWLDRLQRLARDKHAPARLVHAERRLSGAVFAALTHDGTPQRWQAILLESAEIEAIQANGTAFKAGPIPALSPEWIAAADDKSPEWRLACALGSAAGSYGRQARPADPVRHHWLPLQQGARRFAERDKRLAPDARVVMYGRDPVTDFGALVQRRLIEGAQRGQRLLGLVSAYRFEARPSDLALFVAGRLDLDRIAALARALMAVHWERWTPTSVGRYGGELWPDEAWMALRLASLPWPLDDGTQIPFDSAMFRRLLVGDGATAVALALRRLRSAGLRPPLQAASTDAETARLWAASLAFPISRHSARDMARRFDPSEKKEIR